MIDTDKYEGHTPAPWKNFKVIDKETNDKFIQRGSHADLDLMIDAPLLLQEIKRLRKERDKMRELLLRGVKLMNNASKTTDEGNDYFAESFEDAVMEVIE